MELQTSDAPSCQTTEKTVNNPLEQEPLPEGINDDSKIDDTYCFYKNSGDNTMRNDTTTEDIFTT